ncbi:hypothetical protein H0R92_12600 [Treponema sp. OMZ 840]|uniref:hypothetical protein n=1 Tax=Treponema sp. OMZ 840 TaxID=244313 RepID=UPI003D928573
MKKKNYVLKRLFLLYVTAGVFLSGCVTATTMIWDEDLPETETVTLWWGGSASTVRPVFYNNHPVDWEISSWGYNLFKIPAGETKFVLKGETSIRTNFIKYYNFDGVELECNLEPGKEYTIYFWAGNATLHRGKSVLSSTVIKKFDVDF